MGVAISLSAISLAIGTQNVTRNARADQQAAAAKPAPAPEAQTAEGQAQPNAEKSEVAGGPEKEKPPKSAPPTTQPPPPPQPEQPPSTQTADVSGKPNNNGGRQRPAKHRSPSHRPRTEKKETGVEEERDGSQPNIDPSSTTASTSNPEPTVKHKRIRRGKHRQAATAVTSDEVTAPTPAPVEHNDENAQPVRAEDPKRQEPHVPNPRPKNAPKSIDTVPPTPRQPRRGGRATTPAPPSALPTPGLSDEGTSAVPPTTTSDEAQPSTSDVSPAPTRKGRNRRPPSQPASDGGTVRADDDAPRRGGHRRRRRGEPPAVT